MNDKKKLTPLMISHLIIMIIFTILSIASVAMMVVWFFTGKAGDYVYYSVPYFVGNVLNVFAYGCAITYLCKRYAKSAAGFYKVFLLFLVGYNVSSLLTVILLMVNRDRMSTPPDVSTFQIVLRMAFISAKILLLLILTFVKDMGKKNTWIVYVVLVVVDIVTGLIPFTGSDVAFFRFVSATSRLVMDGTIGLSIKGKYDDKDARGTT